MIDYTLTQLKLMEMETKRALYALLRLSISASSEHQYAEFYLDSSLEDDYFYILDLILNNNNNQIETNV